MITNTTNKFFSLNDLKKDNIDVLYSIKYGFFIPIKYEQTVATGYCHNTILPPKQITENLMTVDLTEKIWMKDFHISYT
jgi:hypothetical protein